MPEGDTVFRTATNLRESLAGKVLTGCDIRVPRYATVDLTGKTVDEVISRGKHLFIRVGPASIHSHLKMEGSWRIAHPGQLGKQTYKIRIILQAGPVHAVGIDLGVLEILDRCRDHEVVDRLGPDLLGDDWNPELATANLTADSSRTLAEALLDQRVMAGIGNVYCDELCFLFGRLPTNTVGSLSDPARVVARARDMLWVNRNRPERTTTGNRRIGQRLWVYGRGGEPCRHCRTTIEYARASDITGERVMYWCPSCQR